MPVIASEECRRQLARRRDICIAVQSVAHVIGIFLIHTGQRQIGEALGSAGVEGGRRSARLGSGASSEHQDYDGFHLADNLNDPARRWRWLDISEVEWQTKNG